MRKYNTKKNQNRKATNVLLKESEKKAIVEKALERGLSISEYIRRKALDLSV